MLLTDCKPASSGDLLTGIRYSNQTFRSSQQSGHFSPLALSTWRLIWLPVDLMREVLWELVGMGGGYSGGGLSVDAQT